MSSCGVGTGGPSAAIWLGAGTLANADVGAAEESAEGEGAASSEVLAACSAAVLVAVGDRLSAALGMAMASGDVLDEDTAGETCALDTPEPPGPALTVMAEATVDRVLATAAGGGGAMEPSWNCGAAGGFMGKEPAGHAQRQLQPPLLAACSALAAPPEGEADPGREVPLLAGPAMTVMAAPAPPAALAVVLVPREDEREREKAAAVVERLCSPVAVVLLLVSAPEPAEMVTAGATDTATPPVGCTLVMVLIIVVVDVIVEFGDGATVSTMV